MLTAGHLGSVSSDTIDPSVARRAIKINRCAEKVVFDDLGIADDLPIGQPVELTITPKQPGEYSFTCQMQMFRGTLVVKDR